MTPHSAYHRSVAPNERDVRDRAIVAARVGGRDWHSISVRYGISKRQAQRVVARHNADAETAARPDLAGSVAGALTDADLILEAIAAEELGPHSSRELGHLRRRLRGLETRADLLVLADRLRHDGVS